MKNVTLAIMAVASAAACVPASEAAPPRGAFGFVTEPSPATRGEPFVTGDGWTIRIDKLVLQASVSAQSTTRGRDSYGSYETYRFDGRQVVEIFARKISVGPASASLNLNGSYLAYESSRDDEDERTEVIGVPPESNARFLLPADADMIGGDYRSYSGPSVLLGARAERAGRVITIDLTFNFYGTNEQTQGIVQEDALVTAPLTVAGERLFFDARTNLLQFDDLAAADADDDGVLTGAELNAGGLTQIFARGSGVLVPR